MDFQIYLENSNLEILNTADLTEGKKFKSRFIQGGLAGYPQQYGTVLIKKESLDKFVNSLEGKPVIINHQEVNANNVADIEVGRVHNVWFEDDGWYWCDGVITNQKALDLIDKGWSVSCSYNVSNYSDKGGTENNIKYDMEFLDGNFTHLAIVKNPRYEGAEITVVNSNLDADNNKWITVHPSGNEDAKGVHVLVKEGETPEDAIERLDKKEEGKQSEGGEKKEEHEDIKRYLEQIRPGLHFNYNKNSKYPYEIKYKDSKRFNLKDIATSSDKKEDILEYLKQQTKEGSDLEKELAEKIKELKSNSESNKPSQKSSYYLTKAETKNPQFKGMADTGSYYTNGNFAIDKNYLDIKGEQPSKADDRNNGYEQIDRFLKNSYFNEKNINGLLKEGKLEPLKDFEVGESGKSKLVKYTGSEGREYYINKKYHDVFKNFDLKFDKNSSDKGIYAFDGDKAIGMVMPVAFVKDFKKINNDSADYIECENQLHIIYNSLTNTIAEAIMEVLVENCIDKKGLAEEVNEVFAKVEDEQWENLKAIAENFCE